MTLFIITLLIIIIVFGFISVQEDFPPIVVLPVVVLPVVVFTLGFLFWSGAKSKNHYFDPEIKPIEIQKAIIKDSGAFLLYKIEGEEEEKAENTNYLITDKPSHLFITKPKPRVWCFINMASKTETIYLNKEDLKKWL